MRRQSAIYSHMLLVTITRLRRLLFIAVDGLLCAFYADAASRVVTWRHARDVAAQLRRCATR